MFPLLPHDRCLTHMSSFKQTGQYADWDDFHSDMLLVRDNCHLYNPPGHEVRRDCDEVFAFYHMEYEKTLERWQKVNVMAYLRCTGTGPGQVQGTGPSQQKTRRSPRVTSSTPARGVERPPVSRWGWGYPCLVFVRGEGGGIPGYPLEGTWDQRLGYPPPPPVNRQTGSVWIF